MRPSQAIAESQTTAPFVSAQVVSVDDTGLYTLSTPGRANSFLARSLAYDANSVGDTVTVFITPGYLSPTILGDAPGATG